MDHAEPYGTVFIYLFSSIITLPSRESDLCAIRARLGVASHLSTTPRRGNPAKRLSQRHNKQTCRHVLHTVPLMLRIVQCFLTRAKRPNPNNFVACLNQTLETDSVKSNFPPRIR